VSRNVFHLLNVIAADSLGTRLDRREALRVPRVGEEIEFPKKELYRVVGVRHLFNSSTADEVNVYVVRPEVRDGPPRRPAGELAGAAGGMPAFRAAIAACRR
jgi:hypothetical protein